MLQVDFQPFAATITIDDPKDLDLNVSKEILITLVEIFAKSLNQSSEKLIVGHIKAIVDTARGYFKASLTEVNGKIHTVGDTYDQMNNIESQITINSVISGAIKEIESKALDAAVRHICELYDIEVHVHREKHQHDRDHNHHH